MLIFPRLAERMQREGKRWATMNRAEYVLVPFIHGVFSSLFYLEVDI